MENKDFTRLKHMLDSTEAILSFPGRAVFLDNYPNPFSQKTMIRYFLNKTGTVGLKVYDQSGRLVKTLIDGTMNAGHGEIEWDGRDTKGQELASGVYFFRLTSDANTQTKKLVLLR